MLTFETVCAKSVHVFLYDMIDYKTASVLKSAVSQAALLIKKKQRAYLLLHINSPGGDVECIIYLWNLLISTKLPIYTVIDSCGMSGGASLFMLGKQRFMFDNSLLMFHAARFQSLQAENLTSVEAADLSKDLKNDDAAIASIMASAGLAKTIIKKLLASNSYLNATTAFKYNLATDVITFEKKVIIRSVPKSYSLLPKKQDILPVFKDVSVSIHRILETIRLNQEYRIILGNEDLVGLSIFDCIAFSNYLSISKSTCVIATNLHPFVVLIAIAASKRCMFTNCVLSLDFCAQFDQPKLEDTMNNTLKVRNIIKAIFRFHTKIPSLVLNRSFERKVDVSAQMALKWGLIDNIIT